MTQRVKLLIRNVKGSTISNGTALHFLPRCSDIIFLDLGTIHRHEQAKEANARFSMIATTALVYQLYLRCKREVQKLFNCKSSTRKQKDFPQNSEWSNTSGLTENL
jgi:hypothetical protein